MSDEREKIENAMIADAVGRLRKLRTNMHWILPEKGGPVEEPNVLVWGKWFEQRHLCDWCFFRTQISPDVRVSTAFLGIDQGFGGLLGGEDDEPLLWETMVFGGPLDGEQERFPHGDAQTRHTAMVDRVKKAMG